MKLLLLLTGVAFLFGSCDDGVTATRADALYISVVDESGDPVSSVQIFFDCWCQVLDGTPEPNCHLSGITYSGNTIPDTHSIIGVYPNPCTDAIHFEFLIKKKGRVEYDLFDYTKTKIIHPVITLDSYSGVYIIGGWVDSIKTSDFEGKVSSNGMYFVRGLVEGDTIWQKLLVYRPDRAFYITDARGKRTIQYKSLPVGEELERTLEDGFVIDKYIVQGDSLSMRFSSPNYTDSRTTIYVGDHRARDVQIVMRR